MAASTVADHGPPARRSSLANVDPTHWFEIRDIQTDSIVFVNLLTGECALQLPPKAKLKPRDPAGEWWELFDEKHGIPYYYHATTAKTVWTKPSPATIISLSLLQRSVLGQRVSVALSTRASFLMLDDANPTAGAATESFCRDSDVDEDTTRTPPRRDSAVPVESSPADGRFDALLSAAFADSGAITTAGPAVTAPGSPVVAPPTPATTRGPPLRPHKSMDAVAWTRATAEPARPHPSKRKSLLTLRHLDARPESLVSVSTMATDASALDGGSPAWEQSESSLHPKRTSYFLSNQGRITRSLSQILAQSNPSLLTGDTHLPTLRYAVPSELCLDPADFPLQAYATAHFATHKRGLFRRRVPMQDLLTFTPRSMSKPLLRASRPYRRDALRAFKVIQRVMGDRRRSAAAGDDTDTQWLVDHGIHLVALRDEIYVQLCRQLTGHPHREGLYRGWLLLCLLTHYFPPSPAFVDYFKVFLQAHFDAPLERLDVLARFAFMKLLRTLRQGARAKTPATAELVRVRQAPFTPSVFGESLDYIMQNPAAVDAELGIPRVLTFLTDTILQLNGPRSEGIFRIPGDIDQVDRLRRRLDGGDYTPCPDLTDPNIPASLFKLWLRDLHDPLIPIRFYHQCVGSPQDPDQILRIMSNVRGIQLRVADYVVQFLQVFARPEHARLSRMNLSNLAVVFAPIFLRSPTDNLKQAVVNAQAEQLFVKNLLRAWKGIEIEANSKI
ncbi:hypothetical protein IWQ60_011532 [Tieghemiomyces parasiticus]|uniref:Uncharacterized protein n=1 Tax=Tieghemiomyces parasiticus TaxID=78921 RepID=A0A9W7ZRS2_9FUNG|nr:hypothetical protein IWQ60_011532 [Tieghemiomyces parasiticus]